MAGWTTCVVFHSLSKRSSAAGLRSGFVAGDPDLLAAFARLRSYGAAVQPLPILAAATALWQDEEHVSANRALYQAKFDLADRCLAGRFDYVRPDGGFFLWLDVGDGEAVTRRLWAEAAVKVLPGAYLGRARRRRAQPGRRCHPGGAGARPRDHRAGAVAAGRDDWPEGGGPGDHGRAVDFPSRRGQRRLRLAPPRRRARSASACSPRRSRWRLRCGATTRTILRSTTPPAGRAPIRSVRSAPTSPTWPSRPSGSPPGSSRWSCRCGACG